MNKTISWFFVLFFCLVYSGLHAEEIEQLEAVFKAAQVERGSGQIRVESRTSSSDCQCMDSINGFMVSNFQLECVSLGKLRTCGLKLKDNHRVKKIKLNKK